MKRVVKKYLIPHEGNDYKPHLLRPRAIAFFCLVVLVAETAFILGSTYLVPRSKLFGIIVTNALVDETNQSRVTNGLPALHESALLDAAAQDKANDMVTNNYFAHTSPSGLTPWYWFEQVGYNFEYAGENLAVNFSDSQDVTNAWMNSPEHRANILDTNYTDIGMATAQGTYEGHPATYVVELFGTPPPVEAPVAANISIPGISTAQAATPAQPAPAATKPIAQKPVPKKPATSTVPVIVNSTSVNATSDQISVAVEGAATETVSTTLTQNTSTGVLGTFTSNNTPSDNVPALQQGNAIQQALSDPKALANDFYIFLMVLFSIAVIMNVFIKIRIQYPKLIFGGLLVIVIAGLAVLLNQSVAAHIAIL